MNMHMKMNMHMPAVNKAAAMPSRLRVAPRIPLHKRIRTVGFAMDYQELDTHTATTSTTQLQTSYAQSATPKYPMEQVPDDIFEPPPIEATVSQSDAYKQDLQFFQLVAFLFQNGLTLFFVIVIIMSLFMQRESMSRTTQFFSKTKDAIAPEDVNTTFADVAGCENAKLELSEVVDFLKNPAKYSRVGAKIPKGCLLTGGPGLGKTLLAKAVAGEAGVPFFACSASEFIELFVGVGSSRVRDLFKKAKESAPCIIFIDEIDAIGKSRANNSMLAANDEREQTINQLLTEMDGFTENKGIVVIAATNRPDILDPALVRPGRFDRQIVLDPPTVKDREAILKIHCAGKPMADDVSFADIAGNTVGLSGAELANIANEAAILAARRNSDLISMQDFSAAIDRVLLGPEKKNDIMHKKHVIACHEAGHALVALKVGDYDKLTKISIVPRGKTGGVTMFEPLPENIDNGLYTKQYLENRLAVALGGRAAEEIVYGTQKVTTGAYNDMEVVKQLATAMVCNYGFSEQMGPVSWSNDNASPFQSQPHSLYVQTKIDKEIMKTTKNAYERAKNIINNNYEVFVKIAEELVNKEVLTREDVERIVKPFERRGTQ